MIVRVIIPAYNEELSVARVISDIPAQTVSEIIVVDNGSTDGTADAARNAGATVLHEPVKGYGKACLTGLDYIEKNSPRTDIIVFMDADYSDHPDQLPDLIQPIVTQDIDLVIGSRALGERQKGSMTPQQIFGNWLATRILKYRYGAEFTDLGPFRAIRYDSLRRLKMRDQNFGWTVEMQLKAAKAGLRFTEIPVRYRKRIGTSKVSGTIRGSVMAGYKILWTLFSYG